MSYNQSNLDGGELSLAQSITALVEFPILVKHIHEIINSIPNENGKTPSYCFKFGNMTPAKSIADIVGELEKLYPNALFYSTDGRKVFELRSASGGLTTSHVCYLIKK